MNANTLVIAEAGVNHNGDLDLARQLVDIAADAGADLVKFQTFNADRLATRNARKADYQVNTTGADESQHTMLRRLELNEEAHRILIKHCAQRGIGFFSTGFDIECVNLLVRLGLQRFKIPSGEVTNLPYLRHIGRLAAEAGQVILSTGMATLAEIDDALHALEQAGTARAQITVLHCNTDYPTPAQDVNLRAMTSIANAFGVRVGYSDHTQGIEVAIAAVALGASVIEKHFTVSRSLPGPDHQASLEPAELKAMVSAIRNIELAMGDGIKRPTMRELQNRQVVRKSIVSARAIAAGEAFSAENLTTKRPGTGLSPMRWDDIIGRPAPRTFAADELITP
jgi:N,N'-diacetyllegionaminate synthase